ncbi:MAG: hypothetical protein NTZ80_03085, partial [Patescibacteria group bacterium]|nr:hypothetical protein [Patescibacteria group bacterium]
MNKYLGKLLAGIFVFSLTIGQAFAAANPRIYVQVNDPLVSGRQWENEQNVEANDILDMLITVVNEGDSVANGVMVRDVVPAQTSYVLGSTKKWAIGDSDWVSIDDSGAFPFGSSGYSIGDMQPSAWVFYTYQVRANSPLPNTDGNAALEYAGAVLNYSDGRSANSIPPIIRSYP